MFVQPFNPLCALLSFLIGSLPWTGWNVTWTSGVCMSKCYLFWQTGTENRVVKCKHQLQTVFQLQDYLRFSFLRKARVSRLTISEFIQPWRGIFNRLLLSHYRGFRECDVLLALFDCSFKKIHNYQPISSMFSNIINEQTFVVIISCYLCASHHNKLVICIHYKYHE